MNRIGDFSVKHVMHCLKHIISIFNIDTQDITGGGHGSLSYYFGGAGKPRGVILP